MGMKNFPNILQQDKMFLGLKLKYFLFGIRKEKILLNPREHAKLFCANMKTDVVSEIPFLWTKAENKNQQLP